MKDTLRECIKGKETSYTPIWFMRQAGRYLPEFREIRKQNPDFIKLCLNERLAAEISLQPIKRYDLDAVINNAGALFNNKMDIEGTDRSTIVNLVSPWVICSKLTPLLKRRQGCFINVSSGGLYSTKLDVHKLIKTPRPYSGVKAYAAAKRALLISTKILNDRLQSQGVRAHCVHPGWADTRGVLSSLPRFHAITKRFLRTPFQGADSIVWLALSNPPVGGMFWMDRMIQPEYLLRGTKENEFERKKLLKFLDFFIYVKSIRLEFNLFKSFLLV